MDILEQLKKASQAAEATNLVFETDRFNFLICPRTARLILQSHRFLNKERQFVFESDLNTKEEFLNIYFFCMKNYKLIDQIEALKTARGV